MKAHPVEYTPAEEMVREANEAMMMMVSGALWNTLVLQAKSEGRHPGQVLDAMAREYLEKHGSPEAIEYLNTLAR